MGPSSSGPTTRRWIHRAPVHCVLGDSQKRRPGQSDPHLLKLGVEIWNVNSLVRKEPEVVKEAERYRLDIVGLTPIHPKMHPKREVGGCGWGEGGLGFPTETPTPTIWTHISGRKQFY